MATTTASAFDQFKAKLVLTESQKSTAAGRRTSAHGYLTGHFDAASTMPLERTRLIGSAARDTLIRPLDDIDVLAVFANKNNIFEQYRYDSQAFMYRIRNALNSYSVKIVGARGQAVRLFYASAPHVDIAPVFAWSGGGYALPDGSGRWLTTDPDVHLAYINRRNAELNFKLKPIVRMLKRWNTVHSKRLKSFHLEVLAANAFSSIGGDSRAACEVFFRHIHYNLSVNDPAGYSGDLSKYLTVDQRASVNAAIGSAHDRAVKANAAEAAGNHREAIRLWRIVFGDEFPAYG